MSQPPPSSQRRLAPGPSGGRLTARPLNRQMSAAMPPSFGSQGAPTARPPHSPYKPTPPQSSQSPFDEESEYYEEENSPYHPFHPPQPPHTTPFRPASASSARPRPPRAEPPQPNFSTPRRPASAQPPSAAVAPSNPRPNPNPSLAVGAATAATSAAEKPVNVLLRKVNNVESRLDGLEKKVSGMSDMVHDVRTHTEVAPSRDEFKDDMRDYVGNALHEFKGQILANVNTSLADLLKQVSDQVTTNVVDKVSPLLAKPVPAPPPADNKHASRLMSFLIDALAPVSELNKTLGADLPRLAQDFKAVATKVQDLDAKVDNLCKPSPTPLATEAGQQELLRSLAGLSDRLTQLEGAFGEPLAAVQASVARSLADNHESLAGLIRQEQVHREQAEKERLARQVVLHEMAVQTAHEDNPTSSAPGPATSSAGTATQTPQVGPLPTPPTTAPNHSAPAPSPPQGHPSSALSPAPLTSRASPALSRPAAVLAAQQAPPKKRAAKRKSAPAAKRRRTTKAPGPSAAAPIASDIQTEPVEPQTEAAGPSQAPAPSASSTNNTEFRRSAAPTSGARTPAARARRRSVAATVPLPEEFCRRSSRARRTPARYPEVDGPKHEALEPSEPSEPPEPPEVEARQPSQPTPPPQSPGMPQSPESASNSRRNHISQPVVSHHDDEASQDNSSGVLVPSTQSHGGVMWRSGGLTPKESDAAETLATMMSSRSGAILYDSQDSLRSRQPESLVKQSPVTTPIPRPNSYFRTPTSPTAGEPDAPMGNTPASYNSFNGGAKTPIPKRPRSPTPGPSFSTSLDAPHVRSNLPASQTSTQRRSLGLLDRGRFSPAVSHTGGMGWQQAANAAAGPSRLGSTSSQAGGGGNASQSSSHPYWQQRLATAPDARSTPGFAAYQMGPARLSALTSQARQERVDDTHLLDENDFYPNLENELDGDKLIGLEEF